jgi:hypothetical protein
MASTFFTAHLIDEMDADATPRRMGRSTFCSKNRQVLPAIRTASMRCRSTPFASLLAGLPLQRASHEGAWLDPAATIDRR